MLKILVVYASKHNSTAEIAENIGGVLRLSGEFIVDIRSVENLWDITQYDAVVLGSAIYFGQWLSKAVNFLKTHKTELSKRPVWVFSSGPTGKGDVHTLLKGWQYPHTIEAQLEQIKPRDIKVFHGKLEESQLKFIERSMIQLLDPPVGDFRNWADIHEWAKGIVQALAQETALGNV